MRHYIYSTKLNSLAISFQDFISKLLIIVLIICVIEKYSCLLKVNIPYNVL